MTKKFEVIQIIPATVYVTYHVNATSHEEARELVKNYDDSIVKIEEYTHEIETSNEYDVYEINENQK